jgi:hypothetical protein
MAGRLGIGDKVRTTEDVGLTIRKGTAGTIVARSFGDPSLAAWCVRGPRHFEARTEQLELVRKATKGEALRLLLFERHDPDVVADVLGQHLGLFSDLLGLPPSWLREFADSVAAGRGRGRAGRPS